MTDIITAQAAKQEIHGTDECALLDIREHGQYGEGHPFLSVHCPYSDLEQSLARLVPNTQVPVILMDDGDGIGEKAAQRAAEIGYAQIKVLQGGAPAWAAAGYTLYKGVNLPSKTLGEIIEHHDHPQVMTAEEIHAWKEQAKPFHFFDCRPPNEYDKMTIPGAACVPNGELAHRLAAVVPDESTPIVVTCAGRTRGLIGAAGLQRLGLPNPIYAVENGTQGWALAGYELKRGNGRPEMPTLSQQALEISRQRADALMAQEAIAELDAQAFLRLAQDGSRTLYLIDVRSITEYKAGHLPGAVHAWSGQAAQAADLTMGVRRARVVLSDDTGLRGAMAAIWLRALGYEVYLLRETSATALPNHWRIQAPVLPTPQPLPSLSAPEVFGQLNGQGVGLIDLRGSQDYRKLHAAGSVWATRARLSSIQGLRKVVLLADDPVQAAYTTEDLRSSGVEVLGLVEGGLHAWQAAGLPIESSPNLPSEQDCIDFLFFVHDRHDGNLESARRYLEWETGLIAQLDEQERASFRLA
jgi:rhodanese-related sulfurtransferase